MLDMRVSQLVCQTVRQFCIDAQMPKDKGMLFSFDCRMNYYIHDNQSCKEFSASTNLYLLYSKNPDYGYVHTFSAVSDDIVFLRNTKLQKLNWKHETSHDTCWRDINTFSNVYFDMAEKINKDLRIAGHKPVAPRDMNQNIFFQSFDKLFDVVSVNVMKDETDRNNYRRILVIG